jgi:hypothetical protein
MGDMMADDREFESMLRSLREADPPPTVVPRDEMWQRIEARRAVQRAAYRNGAAGGTDSADLADAAGTGVLPMRRRPFGPRWVQWGAALAAMLVVGIGLGRLSLQQATTEPGTPGSTAAAPAASDDAVPTAYRFAATQHLQRTEALLASLALDARTRGAGEVSAWAGELLTDTRLLLASPAADDPALRRLLDDLDLVLSQIAGIPEARAEQEVELIQDGLNQSDVLLRLRAATTVRRTVGT